jgi:hypothetical protein
MISLYTKLIKKARTHAAVQPRGIALLLAIIFTAVVLSIGLSLADISYKQIILASVAKQSEYAFYNADSAVECALEMDQQYNTFNLASEPHGANVASEVVVASPIPCEGQASSNISMVAYGNSATTITTVIQIPCANNVGKNASVTVYKQASATPHTAIYAEGFNDCNSSDPNRVARGIVAKY